MAAFKGKTITVSTDMHLAFSAEKIWPQLCPVREYDWIEVWDCDVLHSVSGYNELGCVFRTAFPTEGDPEIWVTSRFDPFERIEFVRTNSTRTMRYIVELSEQNGATRLHWTQYITALNEQGNDYVDAKPEVYDTQMAMLEKMLAHYLETGQMLKGKKLGLTGRIKAHVHGRKTG